MTTPYPVDVEPRSGLRRIHLSGRLDALAVKAVEEALMALVDEGERHLLVDLSEVVFLSSAGIRALLVVQKQLRGSSGGLVLARAVPLVRNVLDTAGLATIFTLVDEVDQLQAEPQAGGAADGGPRQVEGITLQVVEREAAPARLRVIGDHALLAEAGYHETDVCPEALEAGSYAAGVAAAGENYDDYSRLFGEALVMDGNFFVQPAVPNPRVDYILKEWSGSLGRLQYLYGFAFPGAFRRHVQFEDRERPIDLERLRRALFQVSDADLLGLVMVAESRGHRGMALRRAPLAGSLANGSIFDAEHFADWLDFPVEPGESGLLLAVTGLLARDRAALPAATAALFPTDSALHLHAVVMQRGHLSRRAADFEPELARTLANQAPEQVCHLLPDSVLRAGLAGLVELEM